MTILLGCLALGMNDFDHADALEGFQGPPGLTRPHVENRCSNILVLQGNKPLNRRATFSSRLFLTAKSILADELLGVFSSQKSIPASLLGPGKLRIDHIPSTSLHASRRGEIADSCPDLRASENPQQPRWAPEPCKTASGSVRVCPGKGRVSGERARRTEEMLFRQQVYYWASSRETEPIRRFVTRNWELGKLHHPPSSSSGSRGAAEAAAV